MPRHHGTKSDASIGRGPKIRSVEHRGFAGQNHNRCRQRYLAVGRTAGPGISAAGDSGADHVTFAVSISGYGGCADRRQLAFADLGMATDFATRADGDIRVCRVTGREASVEIHLPRAADLIPSQAAPSGKTVCRMAIKPS